MTPFRIFILAVLFYILYRLLFGGRKKEKGIGSEAREQKTVTQDTLVEDPVCHTYVPKQQAVKGKKDGQTYYFCSEKCCQTFIEEQGEKR